MINEIWYPVLESVQVKKGKMTPAMRLGQKMVFWRDEKTGEAACISDICCHRRALISAGRMKDGHPECPFHGLQYDRDGKCVKIPANGRINKVPDRFRVKSWPVREAYGMIWIYQGERTENLPDLPLYEGEEALPDNMRYATLRDPWKTHYSRCIENQLDVVHLPFVHNKSIGRGGRELVHGPLVVLEDDCQKIYVKSAKDEGQAPLKPEEFPAPQKGQQHLFFRFPNIWQNYLTKNFRIVVFFVPVDEENSLLYLRFYQNLIRTPLLGRFMCWAGKLFSKRILHEDRRVVHTQTPKITSYKMDEMLIPGDRPIVEYRRMRDQLKKKYP